tara:strand:+ start:111 stop:452 length:342 start_codon:yes stop_codon:yes gene_type:complete
MEKPRLTEFKDAINSLNVKTGTAEREKLHQRLSALLMLSGVILAFVAYFIAGAQNSGDLAVDNIEHNEHIILAICGVCITIVGSILFLKCSITRFLRFWLIRKIYEENSNASE